MNILICDDERDIVSALDIFLRGEGYNTYTASNGYEMLDIARREQVHLILLDIMMPEMDGLTAMTELRRESNTPVILLTAKSEEDDMVRGLNLGADDYITKPFRPTELLARVRSQLRRYIQLGGSAEEDGSLLRIGGITLDDKQKKVKLDGEEVSLTPTEYDILHFLMQHPGEVFSPKELYRRVWGDDPFGAENTVAVHIRHLREKVEINPSEPRWLKVVWGQGYKMEKDPSDQGGQA
ncbi:MAG: response regulator transcription factor [Clostridia bacterium]|nr:response regulator transcription factor [Clostridia bacterium]